MSRLSQRIPRFIVLLGLAYLVGIVWFALFRLLFLHQHWAKLNDVPVGQLASAFLAGWRFDQIIVLAILAPLVLILPWTTLRSALTQRLVIVYLTTFFSLAFLILLIDIRYYAYFGTHLTYQALLYAEGGRTTWHLIATEPVLWPFLGIWLMAAVLFVVILSRLVRRSREFPERPAWSLQIIAFVAALALCVLGIRGRVGISPINWGVAYTSQNHTLNQLGLNGVYMLGRAINEEARDIRILYRDENRRFPFVPFADGLDTVRAMLAQSDETWLEPDSSLLRTKKSPPPPYGFRPNIVIVLMESWAARNTGALGASRQLTPHFDSLASHGILFTRFYATGTRTNYGMPGTLCSWPSLPGRTIMTRYNAHHPFRAISEILRDRGYYNLFAYGGDLVFDNAEGFFRAKHYDRLSGDTDFGRDLVFAKWGIPDHVLFEKVTALSDSLPRPFQATVLTLSNHEPFDLPDSSVQRYPDASDSSKVFNAQLYADDAVGRFLRAMAAKPVFDSTIFVFTADHARFGGGTLALDPVDFRVPLLIYGPAVIGSAERRIDVVGGQVDIIPTLLGLLGDSCRHESWGRDLLEIASSDSGWATFNSSDLVGYMEQSWYYQEEVGGGHALFRMNGPETVKTDVAGDHPDELARLQRRLRIYLQIAEQLSTPLAGR